MDSGSATIKTTCVNHLNSVAALTSTKSLADYYKVAQTPNCVVRLHGDARPRNYVAAHGLYPPLFDSLETAKQAPPPPLMPHSASETNLQQHQEDHPMYYRTPTEKGFMCEGMLQKRIWDHVLFSKQVLGLRADDVSHIPSLFSAGAASDGIASGGSCLLLTQPPFNFASIQDEMDEIVFETYGFRHHLRCTAPFLSAHHYSSSSVAVKDPISAVLVVDCGHSFSHIVPVVNNCTVSLAIKRVDVGGRMLTNYMRDLCCSKRYLSQKEQAKKGDKEVKGDWVDISKDFNVARQIKERCCFVSQELRKDFEKARFPPDDPVNSIAQTVHLAGAKSRRVIAKVESCASEKPQSEDNVEENKDPPGSHPRTVVVNNERFCVPEILFRPASIGVGMASRIAAAGESANTGWEYFASNIRGGTSYFLLDKDLHRANSEKEQRFGRKYGQSGIAEAIVESVEACSKEVQEHLYNNIVLTGGSCSFPGFKERLEKELRSLVPDWFPVRIHLPERPSTFACEGGTILAWEGENGTTQDSVNVTRTSTYLRDMSVSHEEYMEHGHRICRSKFFN
eukprot:Nk52_evm1s224 gene=Nk52_evmTU1s224